MQPMDPHLARLEHVHRTDRLRRLARRRPTEERPATARAAATPRPADRAAALRTAERIAAELPDLDVRVVEHDGEPACLVSAGR
jgi:hypothetical protein